MDALQFLIDTIEKLMNDPGLFENYQKELTTLYIDHADNQHVVSNAIELFFNHVSYIPIPKTYQIVFKYNLFLRLSYSQ